MIRVAIVEDEVAYVEQIRVFLERFQAESGERMEISAFADGEEIVEGYRGFDLVLMDIQMKYMDGMTAAERIRALDPEVIIMFLTNMAQYAIRGYEVEALDFIIKPVNYIAFAQKLTRAFARLHRRNGKHITIPAPGGGVMRLDLSRVLYFESERNRVVVHAEDGENAFVSTLKDLEEKLAPEGFFRCNSCYLVNLAHVKSVQESAAMVAGHRLQISRPRRRAFLAALTDYLGGAR